MTWCLQSSLHPAPLLQLWVQQVNNRWCQLTASFFLLFSLNGSDDCGRLSAASQLSGLCVCYRTICPFIPGVDKRSVRPASNVRQTQLSGSHNRPKGHEWIQIICLYTSNGFKGRSSSLYQTTAAVMGTAIFTAKQIATNKGWAKKVRRLNGIQPWFEIFMLFLLWHVCSVRRWLAWKKKHHINLLLKERWVWNDEELSV